MERISYSPETLFHVLTHFETADEALRDSLRRAGFTDEAIDGQLRMPGSKFLRTFALSPQEAVARLQRDFPESFTALHPGADGRVRLSFRYDAPVGTSGLAADAELTPAEREAFNKAPFSLEDYKKSLKIGDVEGEAGYTTLERTGVRPSLDVNGIWGGYTGEGTKTVIPSKASAKISMRLVPNQDYRKISELFEKHFRAIAPESVKVVVKSLHGGMPYVAPTFAQGI